jgi:hypothetical protein
LFKRGHGVFSQAAEQPKISRLVRTGKGWW